MVKEEIVVLDSSNFGILETSHDGHQYIRVFGSEFSGNRTDHNEYIYSRLRFNKRMYVKLKKTMKAFRKYQELGKSIYGRNFYMPEECFEESPLKFFMNIIKRKCYLTVKLPHTICKVYGTKNNLSHLTMPIKDMYLHIPFKVLGIQSSLSVKPIQNIIGFQAGFESERPFLFPHLRAQNDRFCLGSSEIASLSALFGSMDVTEKDSTDLLEHLLNYFPIYIGCQSNDGGPYRHFESTLYTQPQKVNFNSYYHRLMMIYFLCIPKDQWMIKPIQAIQNRSTGLVLVGDFLLKDLNMIFNQLDKLLPDKYKAILNNDLKSTVKYDYVPGGFELGPPANFRFDGKRIEPYYYPNPTAEGYYHHVDEKKKEKVFLSEKFKSEFGAYILKQIDLEHVELCENLL